MSTADLRMHSLMNSLTDGARTVTLVRPVAPGSTRYTWWSSGSSHKMPAIPSSRRSAITSSLPSWGEPSKTRASLLPKHSRSPTSSPLVRFQSSSRCLGGLTFSRFSNASRSFRVIGGKNFNRSACARISESPSQLENALCPRLCTSSRRSCDGSPRNGESSGAVGRLP